MLDPLKRQLQKNIGAVLHDINQKFTAEVLHQAESAAVDEWNKMPALTLRALSPTCSGKLRSAPFLKLLLDAIQPIIEPLFVELTERLDDLYVEFVHTSLLAIMQDKAAQHFGPSAQGLMENFFLGEPAQIIMLSTRMTIKATKDRTPEKDKIFAMGFKYIFEDIMKCQLYKLQSCASLEDMIRRFAEPEQLRDEMLQRSFSLCIQKCKLALEDGCRKVFRFLSGRKAPSSISSPSLKKALFDFCAYAHALTQSESVILCLKPLIIKG